jgi:hypothetical protein
MLEVKRRCARAQCGRQARAGGRYCCGCFAEASRSSHARHRRERNARRRDRSALRDASARARDCARAKLYVAISRGKIRKDVCSVCGRDEVTALIADPARWWEVVWICREDRGERLTSAVPQLKKSKPAPVKPVEAPAQSAFPVYALTQMSAMIGAWGTAVLEICSRMFEEGFRAYAHLFCSGKHMCERENRAHEPV